MCIIAVKPAGASVTDHWDWLDNCWKRNPNGGGLMFPDSGAIRCVKGFMTWPAMSDWIKRSASALKPRQVAFHFRIATHGDVNAANTHPFPITHKQARLVKRDTHSRHAFMHNGILVGLVDRQAADSDSLVFARDYLAPFGDAVTETPLRQVLTALGGSNKFAIMSAGKGTYLMGSFTTDDGWMFSNSSYKISTYTSPHSPSNYVWSAGKGTRTVYGPVQNQTTTTPVQRLSSTPLHGGANVAMRPNSPKHSVACCCTLCGPPWPGQKPTAVSTDTTISSTERLADPEPSDYSCIMCSGFVTNPYSEVCELCDELGYYTDSYISDHSLFL